MGVDLLSLASNGRPEAFAAERATTQKVALHHRASVNTYATLATSRPDFQYGLPAVT